MVPPLWAKEATNTTGTTPFEVHPPLRGPPRAPGAPCSSCRRSPHAAGRTRRAQAGFVSEISPFHFHM